MAKIKIKTKLPVVATSKPASLADLFSKKTELLEGIHWHSQAEHKIPKGAANVVDFAKLEAALFQIVSKKPVLKKSPTFFGIGSAKVEAALAEKTVGTMLSGTEYTQPKSFFGIERKPGPDIPEHEAYARMAWKRLNAIRRDLKLPWECREWEDMDSRQTAAWIYTFRELLLDMRARIENERIVNDSLKQESSTSNGNDSPGREQVPAAGCDVVSK